MDHFYLVIVITSCCSEATSFPLIPEGCFSRSINRYLEQCSGLLFDISLLDTLAFLNGIERNSEFLE